MIGAIDNFCAIIIAQQEAFLSNIDQPWLLATNADVASTDVERPISLSISADCGELEDLYQAALESNGSFSGRDDAQYRVFAMVAAICGMHFRAERPKEPYGPMMTLADGSRTPIPEDFQTKIDVLHSLAQGRSNAALRARLNDICWLLDRKLSQCASTAVLAYTEIIKGVDTGLLKFRFAKANSILVHDSRDYLRRALQIGRSIGWEKPEVIACRNLAISLRERAIKEGALVPIFWFSELDLDFRLSDFHDVGAELEVLLSSTPDTEDWHNHVELWRLAARAFHLAKVKEKETRCTISAAKVLDGLARTKSESAMLASHFLSDAIAQLRGISEAKEYRTKLRHKLIDLQSQIPEELSSFSQEMDLTEIVSQTEVSLNSTTLLQKLFIFAGMATSPDPEKLINDAKATILRHPLSTLFGMSHLDREGKTIKRSEASGLFGDPNEDAVWSQIAQGESIRRTLVCKGQIEPAMHLISEKHHISEESIEMLLRSSPFVSNENRLTFARGFLRFFQGDYISAIYIITPLLESGLRRILRLNGFDVVKLDESAMTQEDRTISSIFNQMRPQLEGIITKSIAADIERVFLKKPGPYVRHAVAHGLLYDGDPFGVDCRYACWLVFRLCLLPLFPHLKDLETAFSGTMLGQRSDEGDAPVPT